MAVQADRRPPESAAKIQRIYDFSGGLNTTINGSLLNANEAQVAKNVAFEQKGTIVPLRGRRKRYSSPFAVGPVSGMGMLYKQDGTSRIILASGASLYSDKPNLSVKWDSKPDFEQAGTQKTAFVDLDTKNGSIQLKRNFIPRATADCTSSELFTAIGVTAVVDTSVKLYDLTSLKLTLSTGYTTGRVRLMPTFDTSMPMCFAVNVYNGNLGTGLRVTAFKTDGTTVIKTSDYKVAVGWNTVFIKLTTAELQTLVYLAIEVTGTAGQYGYIDGLVFYQISQTDYDNASYVPLTFTAFEPINSTISVDTAAQFNEGILIDCTNTDGVLSCAVGDALSNNLDFSQGTKTDIEISGTYMTIDTNITWVPYESMTFDALIAL